MSLRESIDLGRYLSTRVAIRNEQSGRGWETGLRLFDCPLCGEAKGRGWMNVERWTAGCWNLGCAAEPRLPEGAIDWVRQHEAFPTRGVAWAYLLRDFKTQPNAWPVPPPPKLTISDWVRWPSGTHWVSQESGHLSELVHAFATRQWGLSHEQVAFWGLGGILTGKHAQRVLIPCRMFGQAVAFQTRTWRPGVEPKYLTSARGLESDPQAECGRPAAALLFNYDALPPGGSCLLVEGPGDAMRWEDHGLGVVCLALLGTALTPEKLALLLAKHPRQIVVALDAEPEAERRALSHLEDLHAWNLPASMGHWAGGKDAGSGARLEIETLTASDIAGHLRARLRQGERR